MRYLCGRVLIAVDLIEGLFGSVYDELRRIISEEALTHINNGLDWRSGGGLVDDRP
jgi:hypothetical protein